MGQEILFVAPEDEAAGAATLGLDWQTTWPKVQVKGFGLVGLPLIHCLMDGCEPDQILDPPEWNESPFTKEKMAVTRLDAYMRGIKLVVEGEGAVVLRVPDTFVTTITGLDANAARDLAKRWSATASAERFGDGRSVPPLSVETASKYLALIWSVSNEAKARGNGLYLWASF